MKKINKGLQTLPESKSLISNNPDYLIDQLLKKIKILPADVEALPETDRDRFNEILSRLVNTSTGEAKDKIIEQIEAIITDSTRRQLWEINHYKISGTIHKLINEFNRMPSKTEIAERSGISRQTIHKHLNEYSANPLYSAELEQHKILGSHILTKMYKSAMEGDVKAAKVYLQATGLLNGQSSRVNIGNQTNYINVNGTVINEEVLKQLPPDQLNLLSSMVKGLLPERIELGTKET